MTSLGDCKSRLLMIKTQPNH